MWSRGHLSGYSYSDHPSHCAKDRPGLPEGAAVSAWVTATGMDSRAGQDERLKKAEIPGCPHRMRVHGKEQGSQVKGSPCTEYKDFFSCPWTGCAGHPSLGSCCALWLTGLAMLACPALRAFLLPLPALSPPCSAPCPFQALSATIFLTNKTRTMALGI